MKKILVLSIVVLITVLSCEKVKKNLNEPVDLSKNSKNYEFKEIDDKNKKTLRISPNDLFYNDYIINNIRRNRYLIDENESIKVFEEDDSRRLYSLRLKNYNDNNVVNLFIYSSNNNITNFALLSEYNITSKGAEMVFRSINNENIIGNILFDKNGGIISINGNPTNIAQDDPDKDKPCPDKTSSFKECFNCAWNELNSDMLSAIMCIGAPYCCAAACAIACAAFNTVPTQGDAIKVYMQLEIEVKEQIKKGKYNGYEKVIVDNKNLLFLY